MTVREEKKVIEEIRKIYVANDGTEFCGEDECKRYEKTVEGAINAAFKSVPHVEHYNLMDESPLNMAYDGCIWVTYIRNENDLKIVNQRLNLNDPNHFLPVSAIGTKQIIEFYDGYDWLMGSPEELKLKCCEWIDKICDFPDEKSDTESE